MEYKGKFLEDKFVSNITKFKKKGNYIDICGYRKDYNISETLKNQLNFNEYHLPNQNDLIKFLKEDLKKLPNEIDALFIEITFYHNAYTFSLRNMMAESVFDNYKFATIVFQHNIYNTNKFRQWDLPREFFKSKGYVLVFPDVGLEVDFYVHPDLVDMNYVNSIIEKNKKNYIPLSSWPHGLRLWRGSMHNTPHPVEKWIPVESIEY